MDSIKQIYGLMATLIVLLLSGCSQEEAIGVASEETIPVELNISYNVLNNTSHNEVLTRAPGDATLSVNRILVLPFQKTNEAAADDPANFIPVYSLAKQINVSSFPNVVTKLTLTPATTYRILIIGYNRNDYDFANQSSATRRFNLGSATSPTTLANFYLQLVSPTDIPEFFSCMAVGYMNGQSIGTSFKPEQINNIQGTLKRIVSGLTLNLTNIPTYITSVSLIAEQLVTATRATDGTPRTWQTAGDSGLKTFPGQTPVAGKVTFNQYMLGTPDARKTLFYIRIAYGTFSQNYPISIVDSPNVVSGNRIIFTPNHWVQIDGKYINSTLVFILTGTINLDDNAWDGIS